LESQTDHLQAPQEKKQKLISAYTCHQSGEEMFQILERSIAKRQQQKGDKTRTEEPSVSTTPRQDN